MAFVMNPGQVPKFSILDINGKQAYEGNEYSFTTNQTVSGTSETALLLFTNPTTNASNINKALFLYKRQLASVTSGTTAIINFYSAPTITVNGAAQTSVNKRLAGAASSMNVYLSPTISANGTLIDSVVVGSLAQAEKADLIIVDPGLSVLMTATVSVGSSKVIVRNLWLEI